MTIDISGKGLWLITGFGKLLPFGRGQKVEVLFHRLNLECDGVYLYRNGIKVPKVKSTDFINQSCSVEIEVESIPMFNLGDVWDASTGKLLFHFFEILESRNVSIAKQSIVELVEQEKLSRTNNKKRGSKGWVKSRYAENLFWELLKGNTQASTEELIAIPKFSLFKRFLFNSSKLVRLYCYTGFSPEDTYTNCYVDSISKVVSLTKNKRLISVSDFEYEIIASAIGNKAINKSINALKKYIRMKHEKGQPGYLNPIVSISDFVSSCSEITFYGLPISETSVRKNREDRLFRVFSIGEVTKYPWYDRLEITTEREDKEKNVNPAIIDSINELNKGKELQIQSDFGADNNDPIEHPVSFPFKLHKKIELVRKERVLDHEIRGCHMSKAQEKAYKGATASEVHVLSQEEVVLVNMSSIYHEHLDLYIPLSRWYRLLNKYILQNEAKSTSRGLFSVIPGQNEIKGALIDSRKLVTSWQIPSANSNYYYFEVFDLFKKTKHRGVLIKGEILLNKEMYRSVFHYSQKLAGFEGKEYKYKPWFNVDNEELNNDFMVKRFNLPKTESNAERAAEDYVEKVFSYIL